MTKSNCFSVVDLCTVNVASPLQRERSPRAHEFLVSQKSFITFISNANRFAVYLFNFTSAVFGCTFREKDNNFGIKNLRFHCAMRLNDIRKLESKQRTWIHISIANRMTELNDENKDVRWSFCHFQKKMEQKIDSTKSRNSIAPRRQESRAAVLVAASVAVISFVALSLERFEIISRMKSTENGWRQLSKTKKKCDQIWFYLLRNFRFNLNEQEKESKNKIYS